MDFKPYVDLFSALLTPTIGITTAWIAIQQFRLAKEQMRRELYDRRVGIYRGILEVLASIASTGQVRRVDLMTWARATAEKGFLLDAKTNEYLDLLRRKIVETWALSVQLQEGTPPPLKNARSWDSRLPSA